MVFLLLQHLERLFSMGSAWMALSALLPLLILLAHGSTEHL
jgi:hypothetical protein